MGAGASVGGVFVIVAGDAMWSQCTGSPPISASSCVHSNGELTFRGVNDAVIACGAGGEGTASCVFRSRSMRSRTAPRGSVRPCSHRAIGAPAPQTSAKEARHFYYQRSEAVRRYVLARAGGTCECCSDPAPFVRADGSPYLEPHHTRRLSDGGPDDPRFVAGICPTCHRHIHYGQGGAISAVARFAIR